MIRSMTGFGRGEASDEKYKISVEMKSVNHRYMELGIKMPKKFNVFESNIRSLLKKDIQRGKVDLFVTYEVFEDSIVDLKYNSGLAEGYMKIFEKMVEQFGIENDIRVSTLARFPEVITTEQADEDEETLWKLLETAISGAVEKFVEQRITEGEALKNDLCAKLDSMLVNVDYIEERAPRIIEEYRQKLFEKVAEFLADSSIEENRIAAEVALYTDKICVDEELVRLRTHIKGMKDTLIAGGFVGRKLDFIAQEMNREANTILSKANDMTVSDRAIELKTDIEKIREQVQNIE
ncbi:MAG: YicC family protein [Lachnospiraceae bacterium]|nr:YicC family protein [Lachnospiraceae bacterium]